jgi:hypothetical protein
MIILYNPQSSPNKKPVLPMSLLALGAQLEGAHDYRIIDGNLVNSGLESLTSAIEEQDAGILGVTVMPGPQLTEALPISRALRRRFPKLQIVWGGYFPTMHPKPVLSSGCVDYAIRGHNEVSFRVLADRLMGGEAPGRLPGLLHREDNEDALLSSAPAFVPNMNELPDFPYHRVAMKQYLRPTFMGNRTISHHASYGCPFRCNFCAVVNMVDGRYSAQTAERMAGTVETLVGVHGADGIEFHDNNFFVGETRIAEFAERIRGLGIGWWAYGRVDTLDKFSDRTFGLLQDSGLRMVFMGAETGSDETLKRMNKGGRQTTSQAIRLASRMRRFGIVPEMSFVLGNPPDPVGDVEQTMKFIRRLKAANPATEIVLYLYTPVPLAGDLYNQAFASGFRFPQTIDEWADATWVDFAQHRTDDLPWLDETLKQRVSDFRQVLHATYPTVTDPRLRGARRAALRLLGSWRYRLELYRYPLELRLLNRLFPYQRPEVSGF